MKTRMLMLMLVLSAATCSSPPPPAQPCVVGPGTICTIVGTGIAGLVGDGGPALAAEIYLPQDATVGPDGNLYFLDWNNHRIRVVDAEFGVIDTVVGSGLLGDGPAGPATESDLNHPTNIVFDSAGRMMIAAWHNSRIKRVDLSTGLLDEICGTGRRTYTGDDGPAAMASLDLPASLAYDPTGNLYVMDQANQVIRQIGLDGVIRRFAGQCITNTCGAGESPVACPMTDKLACLTADPTACSLPCHPSYGGDGGPRLDARFAQPFGQAADPAGRIAFDATGNLFLADTSNHRIRRIDPSGVVTTVAGTGTAGFAGDGGPATAAQLNRPVDVAFGPDGTLYVADTANSCVRAVATDGTIDTVAGVCGQRGFSGEGGAATQALLDRPYGIEVDPQGNLYVVDTHNHRIRKVGASR